MTPFIKKKDIKKDWYIINAQNAVVGRLAAYISKVLRGKNKPTFNPHIDNGDFVVVTNIDKIKFTGKKFSNKKLIIPHMGWNTIRVNKADPIVKKNLNEKDFYFVHSYIYENINKENILGLTMYGKNFPSIINKGNIYGVQFHPEKSHKNGLKLIKNFIMKS